jgi:hypothetical protein
MSTNEKEIDPDNYSHEESFPKGIRKIGYRNNGKIGI